MAPPRPRKARKPASWWLWVGYWVGLFTLTHAPVSGGGALPVPYADKLIHFGLFFLLTWVGARHYAAISRVVSVRMLVAWAVVYAAYAVVDEYLQPYVGRTLSLGDWLADVAGIVIATALFAHRQRSGTRSGSSGTHNPL